MDINFNSDEQNPNPIDARDDLVAIGCSVCGGIFRVSRKVSMLLANDERGFGVGSKREIKDINPKKFHGKRNDNDDVMNLFVHKNMKPVKMVVSWNCYADNIDMCPSCAYDILIAHIQKEKDAFKLYNKESELFAKEVLNSVIEDIE